MKKRRKVFLLLKNMPKNSKCCEKKCPELKCYVVRPSTNPDMTTDIKIFFYLKGDLENGKNLPTILFVHGLNSDHRFWKCQQDCLCPKYPTLSIDLRGFGRSTKDLTSTYSYKVFIEDIKAILDELGITSVIYVGADIGASIGIKFATEYPSLVEQLLMTGANPLYAAESRQPRLPPSPEGWEYAQWTYSELDQTYDQIKNNYQEYVHNQVDRLYSSKCSNLQKLKCYAVQTSLQTPSTVLLQILGYNNPSSFVFESLFEQFNLLPKLDKMAIPILIGTGQEADLNSRGAAGTLFLKLLNARTLFYEFIRHGTYANASNVEIYTTVLVNFIECDEKPEKCDVCPIYPQCPSTVDIY